MKKYTSSIIVILSCIILTVFSSGCAFLQRSSHGDFEWLLWSFERRYATVENPRALNLPHPPAANMDKTLYLLNDYTVVRQPGNRGVSTFSFVKNGKEVLGYNATHQRCADYYRPGPLLVYLTDYVSGEYKRVSNVLSYDNPSPGERVRINDQFTRGDNKKRIELCWNAVQKMNLTITKDHAVKRKKSDRGSLTWMIMRNGVVVLERSAGGELTYRHPSRKEGIYSIFLTAYVDGGYQRVSNVVSYEIEPPSLFSSFGGGNGAIIPVAHGHYDNQWMKSDPGEH